MKTFTIAMSEKNANGHFQQISLFAVGFLGCMFSGFTATIMPVYLHAMVIDIQGKQATVNLVAIGILANVLFIAGWLAGAFLWRKISLRSGQKNALLLAMFNFGMFTALTAVMPGWWEVLLCQVMSSMGVGGVLVVAFTLLIEHFPNRNRSVITALLGFVFLIGMLFAGIVKYLVPSWHDAFFTGAIPVFLTIMAFLLISEPEMWLLYHPERFSGDTNDQYTPSKVKHQSVNGGAIVFSISFIGLWVLFSWLPGQSQNISTAEINHQGLEIALLLFGVAATAVGFFSGWMIKVVKPGTSFKLQ